MDSKYPTDPPEEPIQADNDSAIDGVEAEPDDYYNDNDSAFGESIASSTASFSSSILRYREENGRTYHGYKDLKYVLPNDEGEMDRLDLQHHLFLLTQEGRLHLAPIEKDNILHLVLDVGTGTGIWAIDFADEHPESQVLGIDLSPIQPQMIPPNLRFQIDDLEDEWTFSQKFDFIYSRMLTGGFANWPRFFEQAYEHLAPGGWIEVTDISFPGRSDDNSWPANSALKEWNDLMLRSANVLGRYANSAESYKAQMEAVGFENVVEIVNKWPQNRWPRDPKYKELGMWNDANMYPHIHGICVALFTRGLGWTSEEVEVFLVNVRKEWRDTRIHMYFPIYTVYAQKPKVV